MAKGDKVRILLQVGDHVEENTVEATTNGATIEIDRPRNGNLMTVEVLNRAGGASRTITLRQDAVLLVEEIPA